MYPPNQKQLEWELARMLLEAHSHTARAMERYLLLQSLRSAPDKSDAELQIAIEHAIEEHEQIIDTLETAQQRLEVARAEPPPADE